MVMHVGGLASGMDIDSIVEKLMQAERTPLNKLQQQKTKFEWQRDAYRDVNTKLKTFDTYLFDNFTLSSNFVKKSTTITGANQDKVSISANSSASGALNISKVTSLASAASSGAKTLNSTDPALKITSNTTLYDLGIEYEGKFTLNAVQADGTMKKTDIEYGFEDTIDSLINKINNSGAGVTALFADGKMTISANNTGESKEGNGEIQLLTDENWEGADLFGRLGFITPPSDPNSTQDSYNLTEGGTKGQNAKYTMNGLEMTSQTNTINKAGYTINLQGTFDNTSTSPISVTSTNDTKTMMDKIKEFVTTYNGLIKDLNNSVTEKKYRDYQPLTDEQRKEMSEDEIKKWEEKAKSGLLRNDSIIRDGVSKLRSNFSSAIGGLDDKMIDALAEIGITTSKDYRSGGTLEINEEKLNAALEKNPDQVAAIFINTGKADDTETDPVTGATKTIDSRGLVQRLRESIDSFELNIERKAGRSTMTDGQYNIGRSMLDIDKRIERLEDRLVAVEERYWKQFTAMETAINKANQQSAMFMSQG